MEWTPVPIRSNPISSDPRPETKLTTTLNGHVIELSPDQARAHIDEHYQWVEFLALVDLLHRHLGFELRSKDDISRVRRFLTEFRGAERKLRAWKNADLRCAGLSKRRTKVKKPDVPRAVPPDEQAMALLVWKRICDKAGLPFPKKDLIPWAEQQLQRLEEDRRQAE